MNSVRLPAWFARASLVCLLSTMLLVDTLFAAPQSQTGPAVNTPGLIATGQKSFEIPFTINLSQDNVVEVVLQMSSDRGKTWQEHSRRSPGSSAFPFSCRQDEEFWFAIQTINRSGQRQPANQALKPELRIAVDTRQPQLEFEVRPDAAGRIVGTWTARDRNIDPCSMLIQYQSKTAGNDNWYTVPAQSCRNDVSDTYRDELAWWPQTTARNLRIRAQIKDLAGNTVEVERAIAVPRVAGQTPANPVTNQLRGRPELAAQNSGVQTNARPPVPEGSTNYLRSRLPYALSEQYGPESSSSNPNLKRDSSSKQDLNQNRLRDQSSSASATGVPSRMAGASRQSTLAEEPVPQPPGSRRNRFASNTMGASGDRLIPNPSPSRPSTQWRSRPSDQNNSQVTNGSTETWKKTASDRPATHVAQQQPYYDTGSGSPGTTPQPAPAGSPPPRVSGQVQGNGVPLTTMKQQDLQPRQDTPQARRNDPGGLDPLRPQAPSIPGPAEFRNDSSSPNAQWISSTTGISQQPAPTPSSVLATGPNMESLRRSARPSNSKRFQFEYDIDAIGPEGVKTVELWMTRDGGESWRRLTTDEDQRSPVNVEVDSEGIFGFRILVISNEGLRARQPRSGDPADMWVNVDTTLPTAQITAVPYGRGQDAGRLLVQWRVSDANLRMRPVKLLYSPQPQGPWTTIEDGIRNEGQYAWKPGVDIPDKVYLKLEVRDMAGNVGTHQLNRPIDVSGLIPRGHIRGITPLNDTQDESGDTST